MAERIRERKVRTPVVVEGEAVAQEKVSPARQIGEAVRSVSEIGIREIGGAV